MKKILLLLALCLSVVTTNAHQVLFHCENFDKDLAKYQEIQNEYKSSGNKTWAKELLKGFPVANDNTITYQYVVMCDSTLNVEDIYISLLNWYKVKMPNVEPTKSGSNNHLSANAILQSVGKAMGYMNATFINAREEITIDIKENRLRITVKILQYISANTWKGAESKTPGGCYPCDAKGSQKDSHAMAFINCNFDAIMSVKSIINHLNNNFKTINEGEDNW
jgi:hypothetical protein